jgi:UDP-N-acetyl-D-glucosamine dehydrogenase
MDSYNRLKKKIQNKKNFNVGIIGLGYVGLPLSLTICEKGFKVFGFDEDKKKINNLYNFKSYINHIQSSRIKKNIVKKLFFPTFKLNLLSKMDVIILCVPTPLSRNRQPDLSHIIKSVKNIQKFFKIGQKIILESTTYPGTCEDLIISKFKKKNLIEGKDYFLSYSPEREDPGNKNFKTKDIPKVIGASSKNSKELGELFYGKIFKKIVPVKNLETAEATKIYENIFRSVNIALVNELKFALKELNIDIWDVVKAASTKPFGFMPFYPGPGLGGHCIPIDPIYLSWRCKQVGFDCKFISLAEKINSDIPKKISDEVVKLSKNKKNFKVLIVGAAYKKNIDDYRESPSLFVLNRILKKKIKVEYHDKFVKFITPNRHFPNLVGLKSVTLNYKKLSKYSAVLLLTDHDYINYKLLKKYSKLIIDTRGKLSGTNILKM